MIERGKYQSLTMINWNGFFARTFDIDELVTTLSGGNGAGKSTTMAAFITALIPDQTLLHFRNTTEAGSSQSSRDKGLFGKLQPGVCFAALDVINSKKQRLIFGVRLQQVAGRDKKVDIKPFLIQGLPSQLKPTDVLIEAISDTNARVRPINEVKQSVGELEGVVFKAFNSVVEYHSNMFEFGVLPKKLRNSGDRSKFYRLIEASLYGGISSAITRSLRDYLLPQNGGVKKAFQDMESALRENRITLEAIKNTQADRDLFKHLITESTNYVASDYMRHTNDRRKRIEQALALRNELFSARNQIIEQHQKLTSTKQDIQLLTEQESELELDHQAVSDHLQLVQNALKQKEKIARYIDDLEELTERLEEQVMVVEEAQEENQILQEEALAAEDEVDSLKTQLADFQHALDTQQTRALQYQQAVNAFENTKQIIGDSDLQLENVNALINQLKQQEAEQTKTVLSLKHKLDISSVATEQYETALTLLKKIEGNVDRKDALPIAQKSIAKLKEAHALVGNEHHWQSRLTEFNRELDKQKQAKALADQYLKEHQVLLGDFDDEAAASEQIDNEYIRHEHIIESVEELVESGRDERIHTLRQIENDKSMLAKLEQRAPAWIQANEALDKLKEQTDKELASNPLIMSEMQHVLEQEKQTSAEKDTLASRREQLDLEIEQLSSFGGGNDPRLKGIAETLGGVLLTEIYDDITLEDAPYFSAMYGPARNAIVVSDLTKVKEQLNKLSDCPEDLYLIQGDIDAFDDSTFNVDELEGAVCVQFNQRQLRYSRLPKIPLFGRAAREHKLEGLRHERDSVIEAHAKKAFDAQKLQRLYQSFSHFVSHHIHHVFESDPELDMAEIRASLNESQAKLDKLESDLAQQKTQLSRSKQALSLLDKLRPLFASLSHSSLHQNIAEAEHQLSLITQGKEFISRFGKSIVELESYLHLFENDPEQYQSIESEYQKVDAQLQQLKRQQFALADLRERIGHFSYKDATGLLEKSSELNEQLKLKLVTAESIRANKREELKQNQDSLNEYHQVLASLKSAHQAKSDIVQEFKAELHELGVTADEGTEERARSRKEALLQQLHTCRRQNSEFTRLATAIELDIKSTSASLKKVIKEYKELRMVIVLAKSAWCNVIRLAKDNDVDRRLYRRELAYLSADELRSMSDKSLGALRLAVADNEELRDALRASEDNAHPERKVLFYIAVYQSLKQRIRQDIIATDDPVEAIEEMEVELARLTEELAFRENRLAISSDSVASIIKKTIQREQNRIRMLNQGLSNINFGQVNGVRLNVHIRESHQTLLHGLSHQQEQHKDLFETSRFTFSESMVKLFQRVNPHIDMGQRSPQILGEELLDYRNYLELSVEVNRGSDGWLQAESGALSTGEAIGTGQSILLMVVQSWEEESRRLRNKEIIPCRLLFLDEAARLDSKSISTLFELCDRLDMQLLIAAPENISPEKGTTYKLVRKVFKDHEHVHVVGLKGFAKQSSNQQAEAIE